MEKLSFTLVFACSLIPLRSKDEEIDLVEVQTFYEEALPEVSRPVCWTNTGIYENIAHFTFNNIIM